MTDGEILREQILDVITQRISSELQINDIVQLDPEKVGNPMFAACFMIVTKLYSWGAQGYVQALGENGNPGGHAYYRANWDEMVKVGHAEWVVND